MSCRPTGRWWPIAAAPTARSPSARSRRCGGAASRCSALRMVSPNGRPPAYRWKPPFPDRRVRRGINGRARAGDAGRGNAGAGAPAACGGGRARAARPADRPAVRVLVVLVMHVRMLVRHRLMRMLVLVPLDQMQRDADRHQQRRAEQAGGDWLAEQRHGDRAADEGRGREIGAGARRPEVAQRQHEQRQADAVAEEARSARRPAAWQGRAARPRAPAQGRD